MLIVLQCLNCKFFNSLKLSYEDKFEGIYSCSEYPNNIPFYVESGTEDCKKFEEEEK